MPADSGDIWEPNRSALGAFIRTQRKLADLSLRQVAKSADISNAYLSQVERGIHEPSVRVLRGIAEALGVSIDAFLHEAGVTEDSEDKTTVEEAIRSDDILTEAQKNALIAVYASYVAEAKEK